MKGLEDELEYNNLLSVKWSLEFLFLINKEKQDAQMNTLCISIRRQ